MSACTPSLKEGQNLKHIFQVAEKSMSDHYTGKCNHEMIHKILTDHLAELQEHEQEALKALRPEIHKIVKNIDNIKVTIYFDIFKPIVVQEGNGDNEVVIQFNKNGDISYEWIKKTFSQWFYDVVTDIASEIVNAVIDVMKAVIRRGRQALEMVARPAIQWKN